ncbi:hypothetical protein FBEOM_5927 [Fusarium beomiforme]|uniref:Uncharacterized protein n=1 Tax=Fusarium beomiforme TaxID=44412 RepID=A0A9P5AK48_9HYPO|nr:hypothetical protein FBEOM_5927 [Fusarium beomiforme]
MDRILDAQIQNALDLVRTSVRAGTPMETAVQELKRVAESMQMAEDSERAKWLQNEKILLDRKFEQLDGVKTSNEQVWGALEHMSKNLGVFTAAVHGTDATGRHRLGQPQLDESRLESIMSYL